MLQHPAGALSDVQLADAEIIEKSGLFDHEWYYSKYSDVASANMGGVVHYVKYGAAEGRRPNRDFDAGRYQAKNYGKVPPGRNVFAHFILHGSEDDQFDVGMMEAFAPSTLRRGMALLERLPLFASADYVELNSTLQTADIPPLSHAFLYGFAEGRNVFSKTTVSRVLGTLCRAAPEPDPPEAGIDQPMPELVGVYYNRLGNGFIEEIASDLVDALQAAGIKASLLDETSDMEDRAPCCIFMAPHEFFHLGAGRDWARDDIVRESFMFNTEQPQTVWFERGVPFMLMSRGVIDICSQIAALFAQAGLPALHFNPDVKPARRWLLDEDAEHPLVRILPRAARAASRPETRLAERPIDVSFFGTTSAHREAFFVRNGSYLAELKCYLYYRKFDGPLTSSWRDGVLSRLASHVAGQSKVTLNIHRDDYGFFEWHRIVKQAMANGSVVVSEPCLPHRLFKPDEHFFEECGRHIPNLLDWLLKSEDGRQRAEEVRANALALVHDQSVAHHNGRTLKRFIGNHHARPE